MKKNTSEKNFLIFIIYAQEDKKTIQSLGQQLREDGFVPWIDYEYILPGQDRKIETQNAMKESGAILFCFSKSSISNEGYFHREFKNALEYHQEKPLGEIFLIPVRLDECPIPDGINNLQYVDYPTNYDQLIASLQSRKEKASKIDLSVEDVAIKEISPKQDIPFKNNALASLETYGELIGRDAIIDNVIRALKDSKGKWNIAIDGMGGIGKTAIARKISSLCLEEGLFDTAIWVQAPKEVISNKKNNKAIIFNYDFILDSIANDLGIQNKQSQTEKEIKILNVLKKQKILIVLDNLETSHENQNDIVRKLHPFLNPSKALFTSRNRFKGDLYSKHLTGLSEKHAMDFITYEAEEKNIERIKKAKLAELRKIAQITGGSPLALKLVASQLISLPFDIVVDQLRKVRLLTIGSNANEYALFYKKIFMPSWRLLSDNSKRLLISLTWYAPSIGGSYEAIKAASGLSDQMLAQGLNELWLFSFLETNGENGLKKMRYYLHPLTHYFVLSDVVQIKNQRM